MAIGSINHECWSSAIRRPDAACLWFDAYGTARNPRMFKEGWQRAVIQRLSRLEAKPVERVKCKRCGTLISPRKMRKHKTEFCKGAKIVPKGGVL